MSDDERAARKWHLDRLHEAWVGHDKATTASVYIYVFLIHVAAILTVRGGEDEAEVLGTGVKLPGLVAAGTVLVIACAALLRSALLATRSNQVMVRFDELRRDHFTFCDDLPGPAYLGHPHIYWAASQLEGRVTKGIGVATRWIVFGLFMVAAPLGCMIAFGNVMASATTLGLAGIWVAEALSLTLVTSAWVLFWRLRRQTPGRVG